MGRARAPFGGGTFIADTSAWARARQPRIRRAWETAIRSRQIATCPIVNLELLFAAPDAEAFDSIAAGLRQLRDIPITRSVTNAALAAMRVLAQQKPPLHRSIRLPDLLIAAAAQDVALGVLHYDAHFDRLATVLDFESRWVVPRGSLP